MICHYLKNKFSNYGADVVDVAFKDLKVNLSFHTNEPGPQYPPDSQENMYKIVFDVISQSRDGISKSKLVQVTGYTKKQVGNFVYKLTRLGAIASKGKGIYVAIRNSVPEHGKKAVSKPPKVSTKSEIQLGSIREIIYKEIQKYPEGCTRNDIQDKLEYGAKQVGNAFYYLKKRGFIDSVGQNRYAAK